MSLGPALNLTKLWGDNKCKDIGFRIIYDYITQSDTFIIRLDVKIQDKQYCVALSAAPTVLPIVDDKFRTTDNMITPNAGVENCINIKVNKENLIVALKELIADMEKHND